MNITLMAHDKKKELMVQFCTAYKSILAKHNLSATAATGRLVSEATGLPVSQFLSKNQMPASPTTRSTLSSSFPTRTTMTRGRISA